MKNDGTEQLWFNFDKQSKAQHSHVSVVSKVDCDGCQGFSPICCLKTNSYAFGMQRRKHNLVDR